MQSSVSRSLPCLPGYNVESKLRLSFPRNQRFQVNNGFCLINDIDAFADEKRETPTNIKLAEEIQSEKNASDIDTPNLSLSHLPAWIAFSNRVLRFYAYFKEAVNESAIERFRVRRCVLLFYLEDLSLQILEEPQPMSGIDQGVFLRRHIVSLDNANRALELHDLSIGAELSIYGRVYLLHNADEFTRKFYEDKLHSPLSHSLEIPIDDFTAKAALKKEQMSKSNRNGENTISRYVEAARGKPNKKSLARERKLLKNYSKVLRFWTRMLEPKPIGEVDRFILHFYLEDDTIEIMRIMDHQTGFDVSANLFKRSEIAKNFELSNVATIGQSNEVNTEIYTAKDLAIGNTITVFGRNFLLIKADEYTKTFYKSKFGLSDKQLEPIVDKSLALNSPCYKNDLPDKFDDQHLTNTTGDDDGLLRFLASIEKPNVVDLKRVFTIHYSLRNKEICIFEKPVLNSGFIGGKFLERSKIKNVETGKLFVPEDFELGKILCINSFKFVVTDMDEATKTFLETKKPYQQIVNVRHVVERLKCMLRGRSESFRSTFKSLDRNRNHSLKLNDFKCFVKEAGWNLNDMQVKEAFDEFDVTHDGRIDYQDFMLTLS